MTEAGFGYVRRSWTEAVFGGRDADSTVKKIVLSHEELALLLGGIDLKQTSAAKVVSRYAQCGTR